MPEDTAQKVSRREPMTDEDLLVLIRAYELASLGSSVAAGATISTTVYPSSQAMTTLEIDRYNALNAYFARPLGNEVENRSQIVLPELRDTIEWLMPHLMRMFLASKSVCRFDAENQADEAQAEMETLVVNHVLMQENNGFFVLHDYFKDALLMRNGYTTCDWVEETQSSTERYSGLTEIEVGTILQAKDGEDIDVLEQNETVQDIHIPLPQPPPPMPGMPPQPPQAPLVVQVSTFDLKIRRTEKKGRVCVKCIPPEEMRVTPRAREGMENIAYAAHITTKTRSDLLSDGYDQDWVESLAAGRPNWMEIDALARNQVVDQLSVENPSDRSMEEIELRINILRVDFDGDGIAELRRVVVGGDKVGENEEIEETPFASCVSKRMPHRHTGISLYDEIMDLQVLKTTLFRQGLDNLTISNNQRIAVDWKSANFDDLLTSRPGGVVRGNGPPANWIMPIESPSNMVPQILPALDYIDKLKTVRTGVGSQTMGPDADDLQDVTKGAQMAAMSSAGLKIEMIARLLAEGAKDMFLKIHGVLMRHQDKPLEFEISGKWVQVDPSQWRRRTKVSPNVGLGSGNREEMRANIQALTQMQAPLMQMGLVGPKQAYETFTIGVEALGFPNPERFAMDPASAEYQQHQQQMQQMQASAPPAPQVQVAKIRAQTEQQIAQSDQQHDIINLQGKLAQAQAQLKSDQAKSQAELAHAAIQNHQDREVALDSNHSQMMQTIIKALSPIIAGQLKGDPGANAGQVLADDTHAADSGIEGGGQDPMMGALAELTHAVHHMSRSKVATLPDGRQIRID